MANGRRSLESTMAEHLITGGAHLEKEMSRRKRGGEAKDTALLMLRLIAALCFASLVVKAGPLEPIMAWSTYLGVADCDSVAVWEGDCFLACHSPKDRLAVPVQGAEERSGLMDAYVLRLDPNEKRLVYATRLQGSAFSAALRIQVDSNGFAYVTGLTKGEGFAVTGNALQPIYAGGESDAFLAKLSPQGEIVYGTYLGGSGMDIGSALALDGTGNVFVGGTTTSGDFGGRGPVQSQGVDAFVSKLRLRAGESVESFVFGGSAEEKLTGLAVDGQGGIFGVGYTQSDDFPVREPTQAELRGTRDMFLVRLSSSELALTFSTFLGGTGDDSAWGVTVDHSGAPVVAGTTDSHDLPASADAFRRINAGGRDAFVAKFGKAGHGVARLTYFGGSMDDSSGYDGENIQIGPEGTIWLVGLTSSRDLPVRDGFQNSYGGGATDGFIAALSENLDELRFGSFRGGSGRDLLEGLDASSVGTVVATGLTFSPDLPMTERAMHREPLAIAVNGRVANAMVAVLSIGSRPN